MEISPAILISKTADGSPTARFAHSLETMHNEAGALAETRYVYGPAVDKVFAEGWTARFCSVGLGLGYNELLLASCAPHDEWTAESFEADEDLRASFLAWVTGEPSPLAEAYEEIARAFGGHARQRLHRALSEGRWQPHRALTAHSQPQAASAILFDAFSRATSPDLWDENFLRAFLARAAAPRCVFATYASTGGLKRVLREGGFALEPRRGFGAKRECTFAIR